MQTKKRIFILALAIGGAFSFALSFFKQYADKKTSTTLVRIAFKAKTSVHAFDPSRIQLDTEAIVLDNLYSPLIRIASDGTIEPALAEKFWWVDNTLHLKIREDVRTIDGHLLTVQDAIFSLKRILVSNTNAHGNLRIFLCPTQQTFTMTDPCDGIAAHGNELLLTVVKPNYRPFLLKLISSMDFGIIPKIACDDTKPVPAIIDYRNTSGPYYVIKDDPKGAFILQANPSHWLLNTGIPKTLEFHPADPEDAIGLLVKDEVDYISCVNVEPSQRLADLRKNSDINFFETYPIRKLLIGTTFDQLKDFTSEQRLFLYQEIREAVLKNADSNGWTPSLDFFPTLGEGALTESKMNEFKKLNSQAMKVKIHRQVTLGVSKKRWDLFSNALKGNNHFRLVPVSTASAFMPLAERPDFYISATDSSFYESLSLVSYNIKVEKFDLTKDQGAEWLDRYMSAEDKSVRIEMLRDLNFRSLSKGIVGVIGEAPYIEVSRKPFHYTGSKFFAGSPLWLIRQD